MIRKSPDPAARHAAVGDLRKCLEIAEEIGELEVIEGADPHLEMGALYELSLQKPTPPILLFRKIKGYPENYRVVCNVRSSRVLNEGVGMELVQNYRKHRRKNSEPIPAEFVDDARLDGHLEPVQQLLKSDHERPTRYSETEGRRAMQSQVAHTVRP